MQVNCIILVNFICSTNSSLCGYIFELSDETLKLSNMKSILMHAVAFLAGIAMAQAQLPKQLELVAEFKGQQVTGITVGDRGRIFVNFPRWRNSVENPVMEIKPGGSAKAYPDSAWNSWKPGQPAGDSVFVAVQSVRESQGKLYVLDTRNPLWQGVVNAPRIFVFDLRTNKLTDILVLSEASYKPNSYVNDLYVDENTRTIYMTDSNEPGLIVYDLKKHNSFRSLDGHASATAETDHLTIDGEKWGTQPVHSDGIAYDPKTTRLYYHALMGHTLYSVSTAALRNGTDDDVAGSVRKVATTPAPDGMVFDFRGYLYMADLEKHAIVYLTPKGEIKTLIEDVNVGWADSFSIDGLYLYFTNSKIHQAKNGAEALTYPVYRIKLPMGVYGH